MTATAEMKLNALKLSLPEGFWLEAIPGCRSCGTNQHYVIYHGDGSENIVTRSHSRAEIVAFIRGLNIGLLFGRKS